MKKPKKPKKKELVTIERSLICKYYHRVGGIEKDFIKETVSRKEAEKRGYKICTECF